MKDFESNKKSVRGQERKKEPINNRTSSTGLSLQQQHILQLQKSLGNTYLSKAIRGVSPDHVKVGLANIADNQGIHEGKVAQRVMANVRFTKDATSGKYIVTNVAIERGSGTAGGAHSTAYVVFEDAAINATENYEYETAIENLLTLCENVLNLPCYTEADSQDQKEVDDLLDAIDKNTDYKNPGSVDDMNKGAVLQDLIIDYLKLRNSVPNTIISGSSGKKGKGGKDEKKGANDMSLVADELQTAAKDPGGKKLKKFTEGMYLTFDNNAIPTYDKKVHTRKSEYLKDVEIALSNHILSCFQAYPSLPEAKQEAAVKNFVIRMSVIISKKTTLTIGKKDIETLTGLVNKRLGIK